MKLPRILFLYIGKHFLLSILVALFGLLALTLLIDLVELIRRTAGRDQVTIGVIMQMTLLKLPSIAGKLLPYAVLIGSMLALTRLTRSQELVVTRASGVSVWQFLAPAVVVAMLLGLFMVMAVNPIASVLLLRYEQMEGKYFTGKSSFSAISHSGLWLRQIEDKGEHIIHAQRISQSDMSFRNLVIFRYDAQGKFNERMDVKHAELQADMLRLNEVLRTIPGQPPEAVTHMSIPTSLTLTYIQDSFASPETLSFWYLPSFINMLEEAGFSALRHKLHLNSLLASPFLLAGTVLIAAIFSLRLPRRGKIGLMAVAGIVTGFLLHFFTDIIHALGSAGTVPVMMAAWAPAAMVMMAGAATLLHLEDG
ncbi:MAG: LPS export ABC transporter permease LptG [Alphaproteobacteria bacterium]